MLVEASQAQWCSSFRQKHVANRCLRDGNPILGWCTANVEDFIDEQQRLSERAYRYLKPFVPRATTAVRIQLLNSSRPGSKRVFTSKVLLSKMSIQTWSRCICLPKSFTEGEVKTVIPLNHGVDAMQQRVEHCMQMSQ